MSGFFSNTYPDVEGVLIRLMWKVHPWRKLEKFAQMNAAVKMLVICGLRAR